MSSAAEVVRKFLLDHAIVSVNGVWPIYVSFAPDAPDNLVCVYDTAGRQDGRVMATGEAIVHPGIQIMVRGLTHSLAYAEMEKIWLNTDAARKVTVALSSGETYCLLNVSRTGDVLNAGVEEMGDRRRHILSLNAVVTMREE